MNFDKNEFEILEETKNMETEEFKPKNFRNQQRVSLMINNESKNEVKNQKHKNLKKKFLQINLKIMDPL
jgi:hypothetical protein